MGEFHEHLFESQSRRKPSSGVGRWLGRRRRSVATQLLRPDLISTQGPMLFEAEFGAASRIDFDGAHAGRIVGRA